MAKYQWYDIRWTQWTRSKVYVERLYYINWSVIFYSWYYYYVLANCGFVKTGLNIPWSFWDFKVKLREEVVDILWKCSPRIRPWNLPKVQWNSPGYFTFDSFSLSPLRSQDCKMLSGTFCVQSEIHYRFLAVFSYFLQISAS